MADAPPIVFVLADQWRGDAWSPRLTPRLAAWASRAVHFATTITNAPLCRPARISLITGQPVHVHGFPTNQATPDPVRHPSVIRDLAALGYHTVLVGKSHLSPGYGHLDDHAAVLHGWGFADVVELPDAQQVHAKSAYTDFLTATTPGGTTDKALRRRDYLVRHALGQPPDHPPWGLGIEDHLDVFCARTAVAKLFAMPPGPWFLQVGFPGPHPPYDAPSAFLDRIDPDDLDLPPPIPVGPHPLPSRQRPGTHSPEVVRRLRHAYAAKVGLVDFALGEVLSAIPDEAWVFVTADHGELLGDHGLTNKVVPYEGAVRVPGFVRPPGGVEQRTIHVPVDHLDFVQGLRAVAQGKGDAWVEKPRSPDRIISIEAMTLRTLRTARHKLVWSTTEARVVGGFDLHCDPLEHDPNAAVPDVLREAVVRHL